jgi:hypothetical protein
MTKISEEMTARADLLYQGREDLEGVRRSLELLRAAPDDYEALWRLSRAHFFLGQEARDKRETRAQHLAGVAAGQRAVRVMKGRVEGRFWLGVNLALLAQTQNPLAALPHAVRALRELRRAVRLDPSYHGAGPLRVLARLESKLPRLFGGGKGRARSHFEEAIGRAPANTVTRLYFAELLLKDKDMARARAELLAILDAPFDSAWAFEIKRDRKRARELLNEAEKAEGGKREHE